MPFNEDVFSSRIKSMPGFDALVTAINKSSILVDQLNSMSANGAGLELTPAGGAGTYTNGSILQGLASGSGEANIYLSQNMLNYYLCKGDYVGLAVSIGHETGHLTLVDGYGWTGSAPLTPQAAASASAANEGVALVNEYQISLQEEVKMHSGTREGLHKSAEAVLARHAT